MKKTLLIILFIVFTQWSIAQITYTANNNPSAITGVNIFTGATALQDAVAAASAGDIIYVVRSATNYGPITIDKQLSIYGNGLNPDIDGSGISIIQPIIISDPLASGSRISGIASTLISLGGTAGALDNLLMENNRVTRIQHESATTTLGNIIIRNNVIGSGLTTTDERIDLLPGAIANILIANNVIYSVNFTGHGAVNASNGTLVENNLFIGAGSASTHGFEEFNGNSVKNNIFYGLSPVGVTSLSGNTFKNNLTYNTGGGTNEIFSTSNGNTSVDNVESQDPQFTNLPLGLSIDYSNFDPTLLGGSPAIGSGEGGIDMGLLGGGVPFDIQGISLPLINTITVPSTISQGSDLPVNIKGKGN